MNSIFILLFICIALLCAVLNIFIQREIHIGSCIATCALMICILVATLLADQENPKDYCKYTEKLEFAEVIDSSELTLETLQNRNGKLIIEKVIGVVDDATNGNGHDINNKNAYINYSRVKGIQNGSVICTYFIYNPNTNYADDIIARFDYIIETGSL